MCLQPVGSWLDFFSVKSLKTNMKPIQECEIKIEKIEFHKCNQCTRVFLNLEDLTKHEMEHYELLQSQLQYSFVKLEKVNIYECYDCTRGFLYKKDYLLHKVKHIHQFIKNTKAEKYKLYENKNIEKPYKCPECDCRFVAKSTLEVHSFVHQPFPHICFCGIGFYKEKDMISHKKLVHNQNKIEDTKPITNKIFDVIKKPKETIKVKFLSKRKKEEKKSSINHSFSLADILTNDNWTQLPIKPLNVEFIKTKDKKYKCPICNKIVNSRASVEKHYRAVHRKECPFLCKLCPKKFTQKVALGAHLVRHSGVKSFKCSYCDKTFYNIDSQLRHERIHTDERPYKCSFCEKSFNDPSAHARHERIHKGDKRYRCEHCPQAFTDHSSLYIHRKRHINKRDFPCKKCEKRFYSKSDLAKHINAVHYLIMNYQCDYCKKYFAYKPNLLIHIQAMHTTNRKMFKCHICSKYFVSPHNVNIHINVVHNRIKKTKCKFCHKQFFAKNLLKHHNCRNRSVESIKYECDYCSAIFRFKRSLYKHIIKHLNILCELCSKYFSCSKDLEEHKLKVSEKCEICDKEFFCKNAILIHLDVHRGDKFECSYCQAIFADKSKLSNHLNKYHNELKYVCDHCGERFSFKSDIKLHIKTHHLEVLRCYICYKGFYSNYEYSKHKKIGCTTAKGKHLCELCDKYFKSKGSLKVHVESIHKIHQAGYRDQGIGINGQLIGEGEVI